MASSWRGGWSTGLSASERSQERLWGQKRPILPVSCHFKYGFKDCCLLITYSSNNYSYFPEQGTTYSPVLYLLAAHITNSTFQHLLYCWNSMNFSNISREKVKSPSKGRGLHYSRVFYPSLIKALTSSGRENPQYFKAAHLVANTICPAPRSLFVTYISEEPKKHYIL